MPLVFPCSTCKLYPPDEAVVYTSSLNAFLLNAIIPAGSPIFHIHDQYVSHIS